MLKIDARLAELRAALETEADASSASPLALRSQPSSRQMRSSKRVNRRATKPVEVTRKRRVRATLTTTRTRRR